MSRRTHSARRQRAPVCAARQALRRAESRVSRHPARSGREGGLRRCSVDVGRRRLLGTCWLVGAWAEAEAVLGGAAATCNPICCWVSVVLSRSAGCLAASESAARQRPSHAPLPALPSPPDSCAGPRRRRRPIDAAVAWSLATSTVLRPAGLRGKCANACTRAGSHQHDEHNQHIQGKCSAMLA
eukprot:351335-Chlamydomonas_euryale.AAC.8